MTDKSSGSTFGSSFLSRKISINSFGYSPFVTGSRKLRLKNNPQYGQLLRRQHPNILDKMGSS